MHMDLGLLTLAYCPLLLSPSFLCNIVSIAVLKVQLPLIAVLVLITIRFARTNDNFLVYLRSSGSRWRLRMLVSPLYPKRRRRRALGLGRFFRLLMSHRHAGLLRGVTVNRI